MQVQHDHGVPLGEHALRGLSFRLRLGDEIAVEIEPIGIAACPQDAPIRIGNDIDQQNHIVQNGLHLLGILVGQGLDQADRRIDPRVFGPVNAAIDEEGNLKVAELVDHLLCFFRILQHRLADGLVPTQASHGLRSRKSYQEQVPPTRRLADHLDFDSIAVYLNLA